VSSRGTDRRTDMAELIVAVRNFANAPKKYGIRVRTHTRTYPQTRRYTFLHVWSVCSYEGVGTHFTNHICVSAHHYAQNSEYKKAKLNDTIQNYRVFICVRQCMDMS
jgi:Co/Zn/Cd efflux system component